MASHGPVTTAEKTYDREDGSRTTARKKVAKRPAFELGGVSVAPGTRQRVDLVVSLLSDGAPVHLSTVVVHGRRPGPVIFVSAALHGDELVGVEIVRRLLAQSLVSRLAGTLIAVPIVNAAGFRSLTRYMPDRRDLNRVFPGAPGGSLSSRLAHAFLTQIVSRCELGIDLHTAGVNRSNLPQMRISAEDERAKALARAFGAPITLVSNLRDGSLRGSAGAAGVPVLLFEGGEALRHDEIAVRAGVSGCLRVMGELGMVAGRTVSRPASAPLLSQQSRWVRAPAGGLVSRLIRLGAMVAPGDEIGRVADPFGGDPVPVRATMAGLVIGRSELPIVNEGDALVHVAYLSGSADDAERRVEEHGIQLAGDPLFDEDETD